MDSHIWVVVHVACNCSKMVLSIWRGREDLSLSQTLVDGSDSFPVWFLGKIQAMITVSVKKHTTACDVKVRRFTHQSIHHGFTTFCLK